MRLYEYKRRFQTHGLEGLKDLTPVAKHHPITTSDAGVERGLEMAREHPARYGGGVACALGAATG